MANSQPIHADPVTVSTWTERVPSIRYHADPRGHIASILPQDVPWSDTPGIPEKLLPTFGKNLRTLTFPYSYAVDSDGTIEACELQYCSLVSKQWSVVICPSLGGRIMSIYNRGLNAELLWNQPAGWRAVFGMAGAWTIGGVEFNACRLGHQVHGLSRLKSDLSTLPDGSATVRFGAFDELFDAEWSVSVSLLPDRVRTAIRFASHSSTPVPGYWWTNIAFPASPRTRVMMEPGPLLHHGRHAGFQVSQWPWLTEHDWSEWRNHDDIISAYAYETRDGRMGYLDRDRGIAVVHYADPAICLGRKIWTIGAFYDKVAWWDRLSEPGVCSYYELQCGRRPTQIESDLLAPGQVIEWNEDYAAVPLGEPVNDYAEQWRSFAQQTEFVRHDTSPQSSAGGGSAERIVLTTADDRLSLSEDVISAPETLSAADVCRAAEQYWLAGEHWIKALARHRATSSDVHLKYAAALLASRQVDAARSELNLLASKGCGETLAWAHTLQGMLDRWQGQRHSAATRFALAIQHCPDLIEARLELHEVLVALSRTSELSTLWQGAPQPSRLKDVATLAQAETAFLSRDWTAARTLLNREFRGIPEGDFRFWNLRKEIELAQAFDLLSAGQTDLAANALTSAARAMPIYGTGRSEAFGNTDLMFYRWFIAMASGHIWQRQAILTAVLTQEQLAVTPAVAYALRIAKGEEHPSAERLRKLADHPVASTPGLPDLRQAALAAADGDYASFDALRTHRLYRYRADFECKAVKARLD